MASSGTAAAAGANVHTPVALRTAAAGDGPLVDLPDGPAALREAGGRIARDLPPGTSTLTVPPLPADRLADLAEGLVLGAYRYSQAGRADQGPTEIVLAGAAGDDAAAAVERGRRRGVERCWARDLANTPAGTKTPEWLARQAVDHLDDHGVAVTVHDEQWLADHGFGGVLAVGAGASAPAAVRRGHVAPARRGGGHPRRAGRQGHHLRHRRSQPQAGRRDAPHAHRHVGRGRRTRPRSR